MSLSTNPPPAALTGFRHRRFGACTDELVTHRDSGQLHSPPVYLIAALPCRRWAATARNLLQSKHALETQLRPKRSLSRRPAIDGSDF